MLKLAASFLLILTLMLTSACEGDTRTRTCKKLINDWSKQLNYMKNSGRFSAEFIKQHERQFNMINLLAHRFNSKKSAEEHDAECRKHAAIIEPQLKLAKILKNLSNENLEQRFCPPLGLGGDNGCRPTSAQ